MSAWKHESSMGWIEGQYRRPVVCKFCEHALETHSEDPEFRRGMIDTMFVETGPGHRLVSYCQKCGWWVCDIETLDYDGHDERYLFDYEVVQAALKDLDANDLSQPIQELKDILYVKYKERFVLHPRLVEQLVADIMLNAGYHVELTAYQKDGGIDVFMTGGSKSLIGVQVKRYKNRIDVEQIRAFLGALIIEGIPAGMFVAVSDFTAPAKDAAHKATQKGIPIELVDAVRLYDFLKLQRSV